jgi:hypothetical protein
MTTVFIFNIIVVFFSYLARYKGCEFFLKVSFLLIFLFLALRYNYGNDYRAYFEGFFSLNRYVSIDYSDQAWHFEPGWIYLCRLFKTLGFFAMVAVLAAFNCFVFYRFIKKYVSSGYYWFAVFLYVFNPQFMLIHSSAMRQSLAICLFLMSIDYIYNKDVVRFFFCIGFASLFHASALVLLPVFLIGVFDWKINKIMAIIFFAAYLLLFLLAESFSPIINMLISNNFDRYNFEGYQEGASLGSGIVYYSILFILILFYEPFQNKETSLLFKVAALSYLFKPFVETFEHISRIEMYFNPALVCVLPIVYMTIKNHFIKNLLLFSILLVTLYSFYGFFKNDVWKEAFGTYHTIFLSPKIY